MFKTRMLSGIVLVLLALLFIIHGGYLLLTVLGIISLIGLFELYRVFGIEKSAPGIVGYVAAIVYYLNLVFAGCALMEEEMAEYLISRKDWDFASVEMGINAVGEKRRLELAEFERRIDRFTQILAADPRPVFATSIFVFNGEDAEQELAEKMRRIVRRYAAERLIFTDGLQLLGDPTLISADCTHPSVRGIEQIAVRWGHIMQETLQMTDF